MMNEPAARISLQVGCGNTTRRDYVLFFDPAALQPPSMVARADEDPAYTHMPRQPASSAVAVAKAAPERAGALATSALPHSTWGVPVELVSPVRETKPPVVSQAVPVEPKQVAPVVAENTSNAGPRELVTVASTFGKQHVHSGSSRGVICRFARSRLRPLQRPMPRRNRGSPRSPCRLQAPHRATRLLPPRRSGLRYGRSLPAIFGIDGAGGRRLHAASPLLVGRFVDGSQGARVAQG